MALLALTCAAVLAGCGTSKGGTDTSGFAFHGGLVVGSPSRPGTVVVTNVYPVVAVPGQPRTSSYYFPPGYREALDGFVSDLAQVDRPRNGPFRTLRQYHDHRGRPLRVRVSTSGSVSPRREITGANSRCSPSPGPVWGYLSGYVNCLETSQVQQYLKALVTHRQYPQGMGAVYNVFLPVGTQVCNDGSTHECTPSAANHGEGTWCGQHTAVQGTPRRPEGWRGWTQRIFGIPSSNGDDSWIIMNTIPMPPSIPGFSCGASYGALPSPGTGSRASDDAISTLFHELAEAVTNPVPVGEQAGWYATPLASGEVADLCGPLERGGIPFSSLWLGKYRLEPLYSKAGDEQGGDRCPPVADT